MTGAARSWTNAITNAALFSGFDTAEYLQWNQRRPIRAETVLPQFLHEFTHHWCFDSTVGCSTAMLMLRAQRNALVFGSGRTEQIRRDWCRARTVEIMLHPLAEGLALFAEFDLAPGRSSVVSRTTVASLLSFGSPAAAQGAGADVIESSLTILLQLMRRSRAFLERKAGIYAEPFSAESGYLAGYLAVKALWAHAATRAPALNDRDLFLVYLRSYIYEDLELALLLLEDQRDDIDVCQTAAQRIYDRIGAIVADEQLSDRVAAFADGFENEKSTAEGFKPDARLAADAQLAILRTIDDKDDPGPISRFALHAGATLLERGFVTLGEVPARATTASGKSRIESHEGAFLAEGRFSIPKGEVDGAIIVVLPSRAHCVLTYFATVDSTYLVHALGETTGVPLERIRYYVLNRRRSESVHGSLESALEKMRNFGPIAQAEELIHRRVQSFADDLYGTMATLHAKESATAGVLHLLRQGGLLAVLDQNFELLRAVAAIGLGNTISFDAALIELFATDFDLGPEAVLKTFEAAAERHGIQLLAGNRDQRKVVALV